MVLSRRLQIGRAHATRQSRIVPAKQIAVRARKLRPTKAQINVCAFSPALHATTRRLMFNTYIRRCCARARARHPQMLRASTNRRPPSLPPPGANQLTYSAQRNVSLENCAMSVHSISLLHRRSAGRSGAMGPSPLPSTAAAHKTLMIINWSVNLAGRMVFFPGARRSAHGTHANRSALTHARCDNLFARMPLPVGCERACVHARNIGPPGACDYLAAVCARAWPFVARTHAR